MYKNELEALKKSGRFRERILHKEKLHDFASNDYLGLGCSKSSLKETCKKVRESRTHAPKASQLVNGYTLHHKEFEEYLCKSNGFEDGITVGSGFLANIALIEALPRKGDLILLDERYHASGILGAKLTTATLKLFKHNDAEDLENILKTQKYRRAVIAIEGVYSMEGDIAPKEIDSVACKYGALLIVDEAHSCGVIGQRLLGWFDYHKIAIRETHIKMGTLGKAYGSYGAYILASHEIISFLENRAKSIIYTTALSIFDLILAQQNLKKIEKDCQIYRERIAVRIKIAQKICSKKLHSLILPIELKRTQDSIKYQNILKEEGYLVGAIRPPTVSRPILRIILRTHNSKKKTTALLQKVMELTA